MEITIKIDTDMSGWSIVYIEGLQVILSKNIFLSPKIDFVFANCEDSDEMRPRRMSNPPAGPGFLARGFKFTKGGSVCYFYLIY